MIGQKFGKLTVINYIGNNNRNEKLWKCKCECGNETIVKTVRLNKGITKSCGCLKTGTNHKDLTGTKVNDITFTKKVYIQKHRLYYYEYVCEKGHSGTTRWRQKLENIKKTTCKECQNKAKYFDVYSSYWLSLIAGAKSRNIQFEITPEYASEIFNLQNKVCVYTGRILNLDKKEQNASLDRIDSKKGYIVGNIQWVYKPINQLKWDFTEQEFVNLCKEVAENYGKINSSSTYRSSFLGTSSKCS